jgi:sulfide dehydrogenase cytochrome subunit
MKKHTGNRLRLCLGIVFTAMVTHSAGAADIATLTGPCEDCHGKDGASTEAKIPVIGGLSAVYITDSLAVYRDKTRPCEDIKYPSGAHKGETTNMCKSAESLSNEETKLIAEHYAGLPFVRVKQAFDADLAARGKGIHDLKCKKCHEDGGSSPDDDAGILAGQWIPYMEEQFEEYQTGKRPMPEKMIPKMEKLSADDIKALIHYYASFQ